MEAKEFTTTSYSFKCLKCVPNTNASPVTVRQRNVHAAPVWFALAVFYGAIIRELPTDSTASGLGGRLGGATAGLDRRGVAAIAATGGGLRQSLILSRI
ncbi:predicted protein [Chaetomium globosum CBS 148.51]|uniref:Uncharacterized protein n=1 Tax=Chaetomium globosum (strain ATCC 6205 / CBS 148.51 / DSM 1962 / NBRC 6347 / NRRL 1970) TaxID=306901 RepID=Q2GM96_CHAGB|nr:uncharacterized protein CHGG_10908 [Chaetomium globosum CBS 148.51]EAQ83090.1 predicted protein [Chaetomium globosum CBS 148.51]